MCLWAPQAEIYWGVNYCYCYYYYYYKCQDYSAAITQLRGHFTKFTSKTVVQLNADVCKVSRMTVEESETWSPFGMSKVRSRPESVVADCSIPVLQPLKRRGRQG